MTVGACVRTPAPYRFDGPQVYPAAAAVWDDTTIQWRFAPGSANGWDLLDEVKFRASSAFGTLALVTASGGRAGIVQVCRNC